MMMTLLAVAAILYLALQLEERLNVPTPLGLIALSLGFELLTQGDYALIGDAEHFAALVILLLPVLLISDSLELKLADLKAHGWSLFYLAVVAVALSVLAALLLADWLFGRYELSVAAIVTLFAMVLATDPVSVVSIFSRFELPHRLKILCEGESLFNDATALIVFVFIGLYALEGGEVTVGYVAEISVAVVLGSALTGLVIGYLGLLALKTTANRIAEMMVLILTGYGAFALAEHFYVLLNLFGGHSHLHLSGILACIVATITVQHMMNRAVAMDIARLESQEQVIREQTAASHPSARLINAAVRGIRMGVEEQRRHLRTKEDVQLLALVANTILFVAMAEIVNLSLLWQYRLEIVVMFLATTLIRALMMAKFAFITRRTHRMTDINFRWWGVLTFSGIKGGLSVVMLMMIPAGFAHLEMFKAIVIGVILLSTFVYSSMLLWLIGSNREAFRTEKATETHE